MKYHYAAVLAETFLAAAMVDRPTDSYLSMDSDLKALQEILKMGYRFVRFSPDGKLALFEKGGTR
jgi:hypothetical protein